MKRTCPRIKLRRFGEQYGFEKQMRVVKRYARYRKENIMTSGKKSSNDRVIDEPIVQDTSEQADFSYEESVKRLEEIVTLLERGDAPLEQSMTLFREGIALADQCAKTLQAMKEELTALVGEDGREVPLDIMENA
ncbi:MAG: exodeoxyribonuclease VII small subunit [Clostridiaceae bacterium]|nr:exodeoxyribonuclease VII small subunit [Clostridiaceae bacterium]